MSEVRRGVKQIVLYFDDGSKAFYELKQGSMTRVDTRVKGRVEGNPDKETPVRQLSVHGELADPIDRSVTPSDPPKSIPDASEEA